MLPHKGGAVAFEQLAARPQFPVFGLPFLNHSFNLLNIPDYIIQQDIPPCSKTP